MRDYVAYSLLICTDFEGARAFASPHDGGTHFPEVRSNRSHIVGSTFPRQACHCSAFVGNGVALRSTELERGCSARYLLVVPSPRTTASGRTPPRDRRSSL